MARAIEPDSSVARDAPELGAARPHKYSREATTDPAFSLARHLAQTLGVAAAIAALGVWLARDASPLWWLLAPAFWAIANVFEWATHKYPMHRPLQPRMMYRNHAIVHHHAFDGDDQEIRKVEELSVVMMPWYTLVVIFAGATPIALVAWLVGGPGLAGVFLVSAVGYFLLYETIHTLHHLPSGVLQRSAIGRSRLLARLRAHHHHHHQLRRMAHVNFNVTFPFADRLLGTLERPAPRD
jgi:sterol desaturase/sphingolipid hydroxylase (fatty acid hydroxylase superfamily)